MYFWTPDGGGAHYKNTLGVLANRLMVFYAFLSFLSICVLVKNISNRIKYFKKLSSRLNHKMFE